MLVLSRKAGESIEFPSLNVVVRVIGLKKSRIELGIEAPRDVKISRGENVPSTSNCVSTTPDRKPTRQAGDFAKIEARIAALGELAAPGQLGLARQIAAEAIEQLRDIRKQSTLDRGRQSEATPIADLITVRTEVLDQLRGQSEHRNSASHVRQSVAGYMVGGGDMSDHECAVSA